jgi:uridylate kinase
VSGETGGKRTGQGGAKRRRRVLLKLSGEALMGGRDSGIDQDVVSRLADEIAAAAAEGPEVALVIGGGNVFRGARAAEVGMDRVAADHVGMLATVMNALVVQDALEKRGQHTRVQSAITMNAIAEPFIRRRAIRHLEKRRVVIFAAGTGAPFFSTDSAAALRALEIHADVMMKATMVDGVYSADPRSDRTAVRYERLSHRDVIARGLKVMDATAISLAMEHGLPIVVFDMAAPGNVTRALRGDRIGTLITSEASEDAKARAAAGANPGGST